MNRINWSIQEVQEILTTGWYWSGEIEKLQGGPGEIEKLSGGQEKLINLRVYKRNSSIAVRSGYIDQLQCDQVRTEPNGSKK